jgi:hypothetical protein
VHPANFPPYFDTALVDQTYQLNDETTSFTYTLPSYSDPNGDSVTLSIQSPLSFMSFTQTAITFTNPPAGIYNINVVLKDQFGLTAPTA